MNDYKDLFLLIAQRLANIIPSSFPLSGLGHPLREDTYNVGNDLLPWVPIVPLHRKMGYHSKANSELLLGEINATIEVTISPLSHLFFIPH